MFRTSRLDALVLKTQRVGEMHRQVTLFNPVEGIIRATAYGAFKTRGRLRSDTESFNFIKAYLYLEPVKNNYKITDTECHLSFPGIRRSVGKLFTASVCAEIVLKSFGGGESRARVFTLLLDSLKQIDQGAEAALSYITIQFIWRFLAITGFDLDITTCGLCHKTLDSSQAFYFLLNSTLFVCKNCCKSSRLELMPGVRSYFSKTEKLPLAKAVKITMQTETMLSLKIVLYTCVQALLNAELVSLKTGEDIL
ncbi:MAG: DNA repair protein RecO [Spirochaetales bacterium]|nr:DNA repair protein RecO [Spirochaetales bacterium]